MRLSAPADSINWTAAIHRRSTPHSNTSGADPGGHYGSPPPPRPPAPGRGRSTTPGLTTHPTGYATYWQYTTALACSVLAATNPVISSADSAIESFILASHSEPLNGPVERICA